MSKGNHGYPNGYTHTGSGTNSQVRPFYSSGGYHRSRKCFSLSRAITGALVMRAMDPLASITRTRKLLYSIRFRDLYSNSFAQRWFVLLPKPQRVYLSQQRPGRFHLHRPQRPGLQEVGSEVRCFYI